MLVLALIVLLCASGADAGKRSRGSGARPDDRPSPLDGFDLPEARTAAIMAAISYCDLDHLRRNTCAGCKALGADFEMLYASHGRADTQMVVGRFKTDSWIQNPGDVVVSFRGTQALQKLNWQLNLEHSKVPSMYEGIPGRLHKGFMVGFYVQFPSLKRTKPHKFKSLMRVLKHARRILVIGHSLGGAIAVNMQAYLYSLPEIDNDKVWTYTFGAPRVGDEEFVEHMNSLSKGRSWRVVHGRDPVPGVPPRWFGFRHPGQLVWFEHGNGWTRETMHATSKRAFFSLAAVGDHSDYMGVTQACDPEVSWVGKAKNLGAAARGITDPDGLYMMRPRVEPTPTESEAAAEAEAEEKKGGWISRFFSWIRGFKDKWNYYDTIHDNLTKVSGLWEKLLQENESYRHKFTAYLENLKERMRERRRRRRRLRGRH